MKALILLVALIIPSIGYADFGLPDTNPPSSDDSSNVSDDSDGSSDTDDDDDGSGNSSDSGGGATTVVDFFSESLDFMKSGIYDVADTILERVAVWYIIWNLELKLTFLELAADVADSVVNAFDVSGQIEKLLGAIDSKILAFVVWLKIPEALSMMLSAHVVRFILQMF